MGVVYLFWLLESALAPRVPLPPGMMPGLAPVFSPLSCLLPLGAIAAALLVIEGIRRLILPD